MGFCACLIKADATNGAKDATIAENAVGHATCGEVSGDGPLVGTFAELGNAGLRAGWGWRHGRRCILSRLANGQFKE